MKTIVTGGAGFIGSHIVDKLLRQGHDVTVIDNESSECNEQFFWNGEAKNYKLDITDYEKLRPLFNNVDCVFHLAAESRIQTAIKNPMLAVKTNVLGTTTILQCAREADVSKVIYSSTSSAYGLKNTPPLVETMPDDCLNPYSVSKVSGEKICTMYTELFGLNTIIFRYFNVYGPREPIKGPYAPVVGLFLRQAKNNELLTIVSDGTQRRDFIHVFDVVNANILAMQKDAKNEYGNVFNVGTGKNHSVKELADIISLNQIYIEKRLGEAYITLADNSKLKNVFGWQPKHRIEDYINNFL